MVIGCTSLMLRSHFICLGSEENKILPRKKKKKKRWPELSELQYAWTWVQRSVMLGKSWMHLGKSNVIQLNLICVSNTPTKFIKSPCVCRYGYCAQNVGSVSFPDNSTWDNATTHTARLSYRRHSRERFVPREHFQNWIFATITGAAGW